VPILTRWTQDPEADVRATTFEALGHVGLDTDTTALAVKALAHEEVKVRAMAAYALRGVTGSSDVARRLAQHLDDQWPVAVQAADTLKNMGPTGITALQTVSSRSDLAGELARQTLWEIAAQC
jgi:HEAT repeat protein